MEEFLREVQEDMVREKYRVLWQRYGSFGIAAAIAIVVATVGVQAWKTMRLNAHMKATDVLLVAAEKNTPEAWKDAAKNTTGNAQAIALLNTGAYAEAAKAATDPALQSFARAYAQEAPKSNNEAFAPVMLENQAVQAMEKNKVEDAKKSLAALKANENVPPTMRERAEALSRFTEQHADALAKH